MYRIIIVIFLITISKISYAETLPWTSNKNLIQHNPSRQQTTKPIEKSQNKQYGTEKIPLIIKIATTEEDKKKAEDDKQNKAEELSNNRNMVLIIGKELPDTPTFTNNAIAYTAELINREGTETDALTFPFNRPLSHKEIEQIKSGDISFYFFGYIRYRDIFEYINTLGFCFRINMKGLQPGIPSIIRAGGSAYNYRKSEKDINEDS